MKKIFHLAILIVMSVMFLTGCAGNDLISGHDPTKSTYPEEYPEWKWKDK